jgi:hypothetical protein
MDVLKRFSTVYIIEDENRKIITEISKKIREIDKKLRTNIFPKNKSQNLNLRVLLVIFKYGINITKTFQLK